MLHTQTIEGRTLRLIKDLMADPRLRDFTLAGGTALALYMGHRLSIDLDLFTHTPLDSVELAKYLDERYGFRIDFSEKNTLKGSIDKVKVDMITHDYPTLRPFTVEEGIRLYSREDITAMKLSAITDNGTRLKDFIDIAFLSTEMSLNEMLASYGDKYKNSNPIRAMKGLRFYDDIIHAEQINLLDGDYSWENIQERLADMLSNPEKKYSEYPVKKKKPEIKQPIIPKKGRGFKI